MQLAVESFYMTALPEKKHLFMAWCFNPAGRWVIVLAGEPMETLHEIKEAIETLPLTDRFRLYKDMPQLQNAFAPHEGCPNARAILESRSMIGQPPISGAPGLASGPK